MELPPRRQVSHPVPTKRSSSCLPRGKSCHGSMRQSPEQCKEKHGKVHDKLPAKLLEYLREPGHGRGRSGSRSRNGSLAGGIADKDYEKQLYARWDTVYCHKFADGKCKKTEEECGRPHLTNDEAKAKAGGKTLGEKFKAAGFSPHQRGRGRGGGRGGMGIIFPTSPPAPAGDDACCGGGV